uniref:Uncharacterized protein n=2 Tax=Alexandrium monilatum TaxID=311494 RepID=A0A7S4UQH6_9DINO
MQATEASDAPAAAQIKELESIIEQKDQELEKLRARMRKYGIAEHSRPVSPAVLGAPQAITEMLQEPRSPLAAVLRSMPTSPTARALLRGMEKADKPQHVRMVSQRAGFENEFMFQNLYAKFPAKEPAPPATPAAAKPTTNHAAVAEAQKQAPPEPVASPSDGGAAVGSADAPVAAPPADVGPLQCRFKPSIGTWCEPLPLRRRPQVRKPLTRVGSRPLSASPDLLSEAKVGARAALARALLADEEKEQQDLLSEAKVGARAALTRALLADEQEEQQAELANEVRAPQEASAPAEASAPRCYLLTPSVGSWFAALPYKRQKEAEAALVRVAGRRKESLKKVRNEDLIKAFMEEIRRKDAEILELQRLLSTL